MKPSQMPAWTGILPSFAASAKPVASVSGAVSGVGTISSSFITLAGLKKCRPMKRSGLRQALGDGAGVEVGGVGGEDRVRAAGAAEGVEDGALDGELLEDRLDHEVGVGEGGVVGRAGDAGHPVGGGGLGQAAALDGAVEDAAEVGEAALQRLGVALDQDDGEAGVAQRGGDAGAHGAAADHRGGADRAGLDALERGGPRGGALGEEDVAQRGGLRRGAQLEEGLALEGHRGVEVGLDGAAQAGERAERRGLAAGALLHRRLGLVPEAGRRPAAARGRGAAPAAGAGSAAKATAPARRSPSTMRSIRPSSSAFGAFTGLPVVTRSTATAGGTRRGSRTVPPAPGTMPSVTSGSPTEAEGSGDAEAAAERDLEAAAEGGAVDRGDPGLRRRLDAGDEVGQVRRHRRLAELADVGAGDEGAAGADQHDGVDAGVGVERLRRVPERLAQRLGEGVDRRVVDGDDGDAALAVDGDGHGQIPR